VSNVKLNFLLPRAFKNFKFVLFGILNTGWQLTGMQSTNK